MAEIRQRVLASVDRDAILRLEQSLVRIPSFAFEEQALADHLAAHMQRMGLEVSLMEVADPDSGRLSRQPLGRLRGRRSGPVLMFNGHMDHNPMIGTWERDPFSGEYADGWVHGRGAMDEKGGIVAAICAVRALQAAGADLPGDILIAPVAGHKSDGIGSRVLIEKGIIPDWCVNTENTGNEIIHACVGVVKFRISTYNQPIHFHAIPSLRERFFNPLEQMAHLIAALGSSHTTPPWLQFAPTPELPDYPQAGFTDLRSEYRSTGWVHLDFQVRTVPGVSRETVRRDLETLLGRLRAVHPRLEVRVEEVGLEVPPMVTPRESRLVTALASAHREANGEEAPVSARGRLGSVGDGQLFAARGVPTVQYGPGTSEIFDQWPTPNEKIFVDDIVASARTMALTALTLLGGE